MYQRERVREVQIHAPINPPVFCIPPKKISNHSFDSLSFFWKQFFEYPFYQEFPNMKHGNLKETQERGRKRESRPHQTGLNATGFKKWNVEDP